MDFIGVPIIITICYSIGETYKKVFKKNKKLFKLIPIMMIIIGGILGYILYIIESKVIMDAENSLEAIILGVISGSAATWTNQTIKQINKKEGE